MTPMRWAAACLLAAPLSALAASAPGDYARHWPVQVQEPGAYAVTLSRDLYAQVSQPDLRDLAAFNGAGEALAFGPLPPSLARAPAQWRDANWFALPAQPAGAGEQLSLQVQRDASGAISLSANVAPPTGETAGDVLIDSGVATEEELSIEALAFEFVEGAAPFNIQVGIEASDDLENWRTVVDGATVMRLSQGGAVLERRRIELSGAHERYLRLRRHGAAAALPLARVTLQMRSSRGAPPPPLLRLEAEYVGLDGRGYLYRMPARIPAERINIRLGNDNSVAEFAISSREPGQGYWQSQGALTAFRLRGAGLELDNEALVLDERRDREWRLETATDLSSPPGVEFSYQPETWLLLTHGAPPYRLAAGSVKAQRGDMPVDVLFAPIRAKYGSDWQPPQASLGAPEQAGGDAALRVETPSQWRTWVLWAVLVLGAIGIGAMVLRLMREQGGPPST